MVKKGLRKSAAERIALAEAKKKKKKRNRIITGAAAVTTASAMVAAIYAACRAQDKKDQEKEPADFEE